MVNQPISVVVQTTFHVIEWKNCLKILKRVYTNATIFDTICNATAKRQSEAVELAKKSDLMIIIGESTVPILPNSMMYANLICYLHI